MTCSPSWPLPWAFEPLAIPSSLQLTKSSAHSSQNMVSSSKSMLLPSSFFFSSFFFSLLLVLIFSVQFRRKPARADAAGGQQWHIHCEVHEDCFAIGILLYLLFSFFYFTNLFVSSSLLSSFLFPLSSLLSPLFFFSLSSSVGL